MTNLSVTKSGSTSRAKSLRTQDTTPIKPEVKAEKPAAQAAPVEKEAGHTEKSKRKQKDLRARSVVEDKKVKEQVGKRDAQEKKGPDLDALFNGPLKFPDGVPTLETGKTKDVKETSKTVAPEYLDPKGKLDKVHPEVADRIRKVAADLEKQGIKVRVTDGLRTFKEQDDLYAKGRTKPGDVVTNAKGGSSNHNYGLAVDLVPLDSKGQPNWKAKEEVWDAMGKVGKEHGLEWGGDWKKLVDRPHFQLPVGMGVKECRKIYDKGGLDAVWKEASSRL